MNLDGGKGAIGPHFYSDHAQLHSELAAGQWLADSVTSIPDTCIDGRPTLDDSEALGPRTAGATIGLWVSAVLAGNVDDPVMSPQWFIEQFVACSHPLGTHTGPREDDSQCGCGAADGLAVILGNLLDHRDDIRLLLPPFLVEAADFDRGFILRAKQLLLYINTESASVSPLGPRLVGFASSQPKTKALKLLGEHQESLILLNNRVGTTVDSPSLRRAYNPKPQIFAVDSWAFTPAAEAIVEILPNLDVERLRLGQAAFNAASLITLCSAALPVIEVF